MFSYFQTEMTNFWIFNVLNNMGISVHGKLIIIDTKRKLFKCSKNLTISGRKL